MSVVPNVPAPKISVQTRMFQDWSPRLQDFLKRKLTIGDNSGMVHEVATKSHVWTCVAFSRGKAIGWSLFADRHNDALDNVVMVYVHPKHRRKGLGTLLVSKICQVVDVPSRTGVIWSGLSRDFWSSIYQRVGLTIEDIREW